MKTEKPNCISSEVCDLWKAVKNPCISYTGSRNPEIMFIGEVPGAQEDEEDANFVGDAGKILRLTLEEIGFDMKKIAMSNCVKCRTTKQGYNLGSVVNRTPTVSEVNMCKRHVLTEIEVLKPKIVVLCGATPLKAILDESGITNKRGRIYKVEGITYIPVFHPSALQYDSSKEDDFIKDLEMVYNLYQGKEEQTTSFVNYIFVDTIGLLKKFLVVAEQAKELAFDLETSCLSPFTNKSFIICCSFSFVERESWVIPFRHNLEQIFEGKKLSYAKDIVKAVLASDLSKYGQNAKFDIEWLEYTEDIEVKNLAFDTMLAQYLLSEERGTHDLDYLAWKYTDMGGYSDGLYQYIAQHKEADPRKGGNYANIPWNILVSYAGGDSDCTLRVVHAIQGLKEFKENTNRSYEN